MVDWQDISRRYGPLVWRTAYRLLAREADAADCFQETFLDALGVSRRQEVRNWPGLLTRLATARALDMLRRRKSERRACRGPADFETIASRNAGPEARARDAELMESLRWALAQLPARISEVFCLRSLNEMSYEEISRETGMSVDAVGVTLHRAKARLRELLVPACPEQRQAR